MGNTVATRIQPLADRVVVKALEEAEQMRGGLYIPASASVMRFCPRRSHPRVRSSPWVRARSRTKARAWRWT